MLCVSFPWFLGSSLAVLFVCVSVDVDVGSELCLSTVYGLDETRVRDAWEEARVQYSTDEACRVTRAQVYRVQEWRIPGKLNTWPSGSKICSHFRPQLWARASGGSDSNRLVCSVPL